MNKIKLSIIIPYYNNREGSLSDLIVKGERTKEML